MTPAACPHSYSPVPPLNFSQCAGTGPQCQAPGRSPDDNDADSLSGNNFRPSVPQPRRNRPGRGDDDDDFDDDDDKDDKGRGPRRAMYCDLCHGEIYSDEVYRFCRSCQLKTFHLTCLRQIGRALTPVCVECSDVDRAIKKETESIPRRPGRADPPPPDQDPDDDGYPGRPRNPLGRGDGRPPRQVKQEELISKLMKLDVKNHASMSAVALKILWDKWLTDVSGSMNLWSTTAAQRFQDFLKEAEKQRDDWERLPHAQKLQYEQKYVYGLQNLPPVQDLLEGHVRYSLIQAIPEKMAA
eukprot:3547129-Amphidinium_carterae.1